MHINDSIWTYWRQIRVTNTSCTHLLQKEEEYSEGSEIYGPLCVLKKENTFFCEQNCICQYFFHKLSSYYQLPHINTLNTHLNINCSIK